MRALRFHGARDLRVEELADPEPVAGTVKVDVEWCGICGSDLAEYAAGPVSIRTAARPHPLSGEHLPLTMGHEFAGTISAVGDGVDPARVGERVTINPLLSDGTCDACVSGQPQLCPQLGFIGLSGGGGGFADAVVVRSEAAHRLPDGVDTDVGALVEPLAVGWHGITISDGGVGDSALVLGAGPIGLATVLGLRARGFGSVIVSEPSASRRALARGMGATATVDPTADDVVAQVLAATGGTGVDVAFDAAGNDATPTTALRAVRARGTVVNLAGWKAPVPINPMLLMLGERRYIGSVAYAGEFQEVLDAIGSGDLDPGAMITRRTTLAQAVEEGFEPLASGDQDQVKILVSP